ncbi:uncharacterized protein BP5553_07199 [Venustampulla echinocandica]|uniref:F-box domain-containing protein n=1 Tax=Venustampulla echinocandica TaxID=2656787 RepID=A0A370TIT8_9HELO|nr:uncharacterized protein BP5553_07199 [Venustampulla echinocandica]RDL35268.1 hypothetical protein BP5553_07199 [Venustampulla echinocandica]
MASRHSIVGLPTELIQHILSFLPDATSLLSMILTCPSVYNAFIKVEVLITSQVVRNLVGPEVLPEAVAALTSSLLAPWERESMQTFVDDQLLSRQEPPRSWTLSKALALNHLHYHVEYFALSFGSHALAKLLAAGDVNDMLARSPTPSELHRIQRVLYRFEIYCNLFRGRKPAVFDIDEHRGVFFSKFAPWENEQLGCISDYLAHNVSPAFNEIADHDVAWGSAGIEDAFDLDSRRIQHTLSLGLAYLYKIVVAETYNERYKLLYNLYPKYLVDGFLYEGLSLANEPADALELAEYDQDDEKEFDRRYSPFVRELDLGPIQAWRWAHQHETRATFVYASPQSALREQGYVFWDLSRLEAWPAFQSPWEPPDTTAADNERISYRASLAMRDKCIRRAQIYGLGGRGWWSPDDESKVVYPPGVSAPERKTGIGKTSQKAAEDFQHRVANGIERPAWQNWVPRAPTGHR